MRDGFRRLRPDPRRCAADLLLAVPLALAALATRHVGTTREGSTITEHAWYEVAVLGLAAVAAWEALRRRSFRESGPVRPHESLVWLALAAPIFVGALTAMVTSTHSGPPRLYGPEVVAGGGRYQVARGRGMYTIATEVGGVPWHANWRLIPPGDFHQRMARVVEPAGQVGPLAAAPGGVVMLLYGAGWCLRAYDGERSRELSGDDLASISPFSLLGAEGAGSESSLEGLEAILRSARDPDGERDGTWPVPVLPSEDALLRTLEHANPWVRDATRRLIRAGGPKRYPRATAAL